MLDSQPDSNEHRDSNSQDAMVSGENEITTGANNSNFVGESGDGEEGYIGEFSRDYINAEIFKLFDVDNSGAITKSDLQEVGSQMGWDNKQSKYSVLFRYTAMCVMIHQSVVANSV